MRCIVVAYGENRGIGYEGRLPWHLPSDMRRFRQLTGGGTVLMGRKTYQSLPDPYRPLPRRRNVVLSANADFDPGAVDARSGGEDDTSVEVHADIEAALAASGEDCFVIGGGSVYEQTLPYVQRVYATIVHTSPLSDTYFPGLPVEQWRRSERGQDICENGTRFHFATYDRFR